MMGDKKRKRMRGRNKGKLKRRKERMETNYREILTRVCGRGTKCPEGKRVEGPLQGKGEGTRLEKNEDGKRLSRDRERAGVYEGGGE